MIVEWKRLEEGEAENGRLSNRLAPEAILSQEFCPNLNTVVKIENDGRLRVSVRFRPRSLACALT